MGDVLESAAKGAGVGATIGSVVPGVGTAAGAAIGALAGAAGEIAAEELGRKVEAERGKTVMNAVVDNPGPKKKTSKHSGDGNPAPRRRRVDAIDTSDGYSLVSVSTDFRNRKVCVCFTAEDLTKVPSIIESLMREAK